MRKGGSFKSTVIYNACYSMDYCEYLWIIFNAKQGLIYLKLNQCDVCLFVFVLFFQEKYFGRRRI